VAGRQALAHPWFTAAPDLTDREMEEAEEDDDALRGVEAAHPSPLA
jgi:hypothetical protein